MIVDSLSPARLPPPSFLMSPLPRDASMDTYGDSDSTLSELASIASSSPLSSPASSPSPPPELRYSMHIRQHLRSSAYPSPPSSQETSQSSSPVPDGVESGVTTDKDRPPPSKRRRITKETGRSLQYLDLRNDEVEPDEKATLDKLLKVLHKKQKIVVIAGAGISVSAGIPDFRSSTGLFTMLKSEHKLKGSGKHLFDASVYKDDNSTTSFHAMVSSMSRQCKSARPTAFHQMLATLAKDDRLLRLYTQNVDGIDTSLEPLATRVPLRKDDEGKWPRTVQLHGGLDKMVCSKCNTVSNLDADLFDGAVPPLCQSCEEIDTIRTGIENKRSHGIGRLRPRMVLYNEHNPDAEAIGALTKADLRKRPDAVIVVGTTLKVPGVRRIVREMCGVVRGRRGGVTVWINNDPEPVGKEFDDCWDIVVRGSCDEVARNAALRHWSEKPDDYREVSDEEANKADAKAANVVVPKKMLPTVLPPDGEPLRERQRNKSFKTPGFATPQHDRLQPPDWSPLTSRRSSIEQSIEDRDLDDNIHLATPSKSRTASPLKKVISALDILKDFGKPNPTPKKAVSKTAVAKITKLTQTNKPAAPAKKTNVKVIKKHSSLAKTQVAAKPAATGATITATFAQSKAVSAIGKDAKGKSGSGVPAKEPMHPLSPSHPKHNLSPRASFAELKAEGINGNGKRSSVD